MAANPGWGRGGRSPHYFRMRGRSPEAVPSLQSFVFPPPPPLFFFFPPLHSLLHLFFTLLLTFLLASLAKLVPRPLSKCDLHGWDDGKKYTPMWGGVNKNCALRAQIFYLT